MFLTETVNRTCSLEEALDFDNSSDVIAGFMNRYNVSEAEAEAIFEETKKWLWLAAKASEEEKFSLSIDKPLAIIDEMWHNFILHTRSYHKYCMEKFRKFIHHEPTSTKAKLAYQEKVSENPTAEIKAWKDRYQKQLAYIYDNLGAETVVKWYEELPSKYNPTYLETLKKRS
ncbi:hypothetical protein GCM10027429_18510 [Marivirga atlantica]|jgi:hypothetical protein|uniref:Uncharacterized protein n=1 Tax=Marivirga atlantica TaxID=1548457 RepID=A0A937DH35_9BACT|nr:hypothetical protein [Marivirga atlantica]MBL0765468.1 hypothetical protein [Marivirga atlantica]